MLDLSYGFTNNFFVIGHLKSVCVDDISISLPESKEPGIAERTHSREEDWKSSPCRSCKLARSETQDYSNFLFFFTRNQRIAKKRIQERAKEKQTWFRHIPELRKRMIEENFSALLIDPSWRHHLFAADFACVQEKNKSYRPRPRKKCDEKKEMFSLINSHSIHLTETNTKLMAN